MEEVDREISEMKLSLNARARIVAESYLVAVRSYHVCSYTLTDWYMSVDQYMSSFFTFFVAVGFVRYTWKNILGCTSCRDCGSPPRYAPTCVIEQGSSCV